MELLVKVNDFLKMQFKIRSLKQLIVIRWNSVYVLGKTKNLVLSFNINFRLNNSTKLLNNYRLKKKKAIQTDKTPDIILFPYLSNLCFPEVQL